MKNLKMTDTLARRTEQLNLLARDRSVKNRKRAEEAALAIELMADGVFDACMVCHLQIPERRLQQIPETTRCARCDGQELRN